MTTERTLDSATQSEAAGKYLTFGLGNESYGIEVLKVREIIKLVPITALPGMPDYIKGVINLRGKIISVVDLRIKFGVATTENTERTCIVVAQLKVHGTGALPLGLIVDAVEEVSSIPAEDIEETPEFGTAVDTAYILGIAKVKGAVKALLDIDRLLADTTLSEITSAAQAQGSLV